MGDDNSRQPKKMHHLKPDGSAPGVNLLGSLLGEDAIRNTITPFVDYLETAVVVYELDGTPVGEVLTGNRYCEILLAAHGQGADNQGAEERADSRGCVQTSREAAMAAVASGVVQECNCCGEMILSASPIFASGQTIGAVVGAVSEVPSSEKVVRLVSARSGVDFDKLWTAVNESFHKPDYLYSAARKHLELLALTIGRLYENTLETMETFQRVISQEKELRGAREFEDRILSSMADGVYTTDAEGRFTFINPAITAVTGYTLDDLSSMKMTDFIPEDQGELIKHMGRRRQEGLVDSYELDIICKDGQRITVSQTVAPLYREKEIVGKVGVVTDITEQRALERAMQEQNRRLNLLQSFTSKSISGLTTTNVFDTLAAEVAQTLGYDYCSIFLLSQDEKRLELVGRKSSLQEDVEALNRSGIHDLDNSQFLTTPVARAFLSGEQTIVRDATNFEGFERVREVAKGLGIKSMVATPLEYQGKRLGTLIAHIKEVHDFTDGELDFLKTVAAQVSSIAGSARVYKQLIHSEERYRDLYNGSADWMYSMNEDGTILECNQTMADALGYGKDEIVGHHIYDFETEEDRAKAKRAIKETIKDGKFQADRNFITRDGEHLVLAIHARFVNDSDTGDYHWLVSARDVTASRKTERQVNLLAAAVQNTKESVIITDLQGRVISVNDAGAALFGCEAKDLLGISLEEFWSERNPEKLKKEIGRASLEGAGWEGELWFMRLDGSEFPVYISVCRVEEENGKPMALVCMIRDITENRRMTEEILSRNRELAVLNAVATTTAQSLDLHSILQASLISVVESMSYDAGIIYLLDEANSLLKAGAAENIPPEILEFIGEQKVGEGLAGEVAGQRDPLFIEDIRKSPYACPPAMECPVSSQAGVPIIAKDRMLGVMSVTTFNPHEFSDQEKSLLAAVARSIGVAIENASLFDSATRAKAEWETTFDAMTNGVSIHDRDYTILRANRSLAALLGTTPDQLIGKKCYEVFHNLEHPIAECPHRQVMASGNNVTIIVEEPSLGLTLSLSADPILGADGEVVGIIHDVRDITEQEQLREQLTQSEKLRALGEMAGGVAHDFNNFLTVILGNSQLLLADEDNDRETREALNTIERAATDASETVRRIQEFTRVRTARSFSTVDINTVINNSIEVARPRWRGEAEARGISIQMNVELGELPPVNGNESELGEVMVNLLLNAVDAIPDGGTISVSSGVDSDGWIEIEVTDTGHGMEDDIRSRIFEPFFSTKGPRGSGLGLSLVYGIVCRHGGNIIVESKAGDGSKFTVHLPVATIADMESVDKLLPQTEVGTERVKRGKVLVIDDESMIRALLSDILQAMGQEVETAEAGGEGLGKFEAAVFAASRSLASKEEPGEDGPDRPFDLVLTDLGMPEMSGWEVVERIKEMSPATPVALITGWGDQLDPRKMEESRVDLVMAKPFSVAEVKRLVSEALAEKK